MLDLGTLKIGIEVDSSKAEQGLNELQSDIKNAGSTAKSSKQDFESAGKGMSTMGDKAQGSVKQVSALQIAMGNLIAKGVQKLASIISGSFSSAISRVDKLNAYTRSMEALGYASDDTEAAMDKILDTIQPFPMSLDDATAASQRFVALFDDIEKGTDVWADITDMTLASGQGMEAAQRAQDSWYKMLAAGKPDMEHWQSIVETMPAQLSQLAKSTLGEKASSQDLFEAWKDGTVTTDDLIAKINELDEKGGEGFDSFRQQAEGANAGIQTAFENMKLAVTRNMANIIEEATSDGGIDVAAVTDKVSKGIDKIGDSAKKAITWLKQNAATVKIVVAAIGGMLTALAAWTAATKIQAAAQALLNIALNANPIGLVVIAIAGLVAALVAAYKNSETFRKAVDSLWSAIKSFASRAVAAFNAFKNTVISVFNAIKAKIDAAKRAWENFKSALKKRVTFLVNDGAIGTAIQKCKDLVNWWQNVLDKANKKATFHQEQKTTGGSTGGTKKQRVGLREVPYDGYLAELHKGEAVLTAAEANQYNKAINKILDTEGIVQKQAPSENSIVNNYNFGDITVDVNDLKDLTTVDQFISMMQQAKAFA